MKLFLAKIFLGLGGLLGLVSPVQQTSTQQLGAFNPTGGQTYRLQSSMSSSQSTMTLSSFKEPVSGIKYTMSYLNSSIMYGTIEPQNNTNKEFVSFTGITQNSDGTATLTGVTRGLSFSYPYTASSTLQKSHAGQSIFILSNPPQFYTQQFILSNTVSTSSVSTIISSTTPWRYDLVPTNHANGTFVSTTSELASVAYVNAVSFAGGVNATESTKGISELATGIEQASSTATGSTGAGLIKQAKYSTSTPVSSCDGYSSVPGSLCSIIARNTGTIHPNFIATSSVDTYRWGGLSFFTGNTLLTASTTLTATTSVAGTNAVSNAFIINNVPYGFPSSQGSANTALVNNGSGTLSWTSVAAPKYSYASTSSATVGANVTYTSNSVTIPAGTLTASSTISVVGSYVCVSGGISANTCSLTLEDSVGNVYASYTVTKAATSRTVSVNYNIRLVSNNSTSAQSSVTDGNEYQTGGALDVSPYSTSNTSSIDWSVARTFRLKFVTTSGSSNTGTLNPFTIIVNP